MPLQGVTDMRHRQMAAAACAPVLVLAMALGGCSTTEQQGTSSPTPSPEVLEITDTGLAYLDASSTDGRWLVGSRPRAGGSSTPNPLIRLDSRTGEETVLCDWADPDLGYCSLAEEGGMIPERPELLLELVDDDTVGWFPSGGVYLVDTATGDRTRIDTDSSGQPLTPAWTPRPCEEGCDYHTAPRLSISTDAISADGRIAAFCANFEAPKEPSLYVKDLATGELTRTDVRCGVLRFGREDDHDEWNDEGVSGPEVSADGSLVHVAGDRSSGGEYGRIGWAADNLYVTATGEARALPGSGAMTRDGRTAVLRSGEQAEIPEAQVRVEYVAYDVASGDTTAVPWLRDFLAELTAPAPVPDLFENASDDGRLVLNGTSVAQLATGAVTDVASLLRQEGYVPTTEWGPLRITGDGTTIFADVIAGDPRAESNNGVLSVTGWGWEPTAHATLTLLDEATDLRVDIDPDTAAPDGTAGPWTFQVQQAGEDGMASAEWTTLPEQYVTQRPDNTLVLDLPSGAYRVLVPAQNGYRAYLSAGEWIEPERGE